jgi:hypothetical protein
LENRQINNYEELKVSTATISSNGTQFVSIGSFNYKSLIGFEFSVSRLYETQLKEVGVNSNVKIEFINIIFKNKFTFNNRKIFKQSLEFIKCYFYFIPSFGDKIFESKIKFRLCEFERIYIHNATFNEYLNFYDCLFFGKVIILKCSFNDNVVFTKSTFQSNCLFTYSNFEKLGIFSRAKFHDKDKNPTALDLSQAIINGQLIFFDTILGNYKAFKIDSDSKNFDKTINEGDVIPMQNKRETFRIIKHQLLQQNNVIEAEKYDKLEKQTLLEEKELEAIFEDNVLKTFKILFTDYFVLKLNKYSNNHKTSWLYALIFTLGVALISHSILSISESNDFCDGLKFIKLLNPIDFSFYSDAHSGKIYTVYFLAKISIGFGIYQLIQAFRKYR